MKHVKKFLSLAAVLTLVVALSGCIWWFSIDIWLDPQYELNQVIVKAYFGTGYARERNITKAVHVEREIATGMSYEYDMLRDPSHYTWLTLLVTSGTTDKIMCYWTAHHPGPGWTHTVSLTIQDYPTGQKWTATITRSI